METKSDDSEIGNLVELKRHITNSKITINRLNILPKAKENLKVYIDTLE